MQRRIIPKLDDWHDAIASVWDVEIRAALPDGGNIAFLVWGDPSLYDNTMRIAERVRARMTLSVTVIPGITAIQALTVGHAIPLNEVAAPLWLLPGVDCGKTAGPRMPIRWW